MEIEIKEQAGSPRSSVFARTKRNMISSRNCKEEKSKPIICCGVVDPSGDRNLEGSQTFTIVLVNTVPTCKSN